MSPWMDERYYFVIEAMVLFYVEKFCVCLPCKDKSKYVCVCCKTIYFLHGYRIQCRKERKKEEQEKNSNIHNKSKMSLFIMTSKIE
jgi:hypothetical protein